MIPINFQKCWQRDFFNDQAPSSWWSIPFFDVWCGGDNVGEVICQSLLEVKQLIVSVINQVENSLKFKFMNVKLNFKMQKR